MSECTTSCKNNSAIRLHADFVMYDDDGTQLLVHCLSDAEFDPAADVHVIAVPADNVLSHFTVHINQYFQWL